MQRQPGTDSAAVAAVHRASAANNEHHHNHYIVTTIVHRMQVGATRALVDALGTHLRT
jgi:hypothetical protein